METMEGQRCIAGSTKAHQTLKSVGGEQQRIYTEDHFVIWDQLQVWIGVPPSEAGTHYAGYTCAHSHDGTRRTTRLVKNTRMSTKELTGYI